MNYASQVLCSTLKKEGRERGMMGKDTQRAFANRVRRERRRSVGDKVSLSHHRPSSTISHVKRYKQRWEGGRSCWTRQ